MAELYTTGVNRIIYKAEGFATGKTVTGYLWSPAKVKSSLQAFTELELGLYYLDFDFASAGTWTGVFFEGGVAKTPGVFRVKELATVLDAVKAKTDLLPSGITKNVALSNFEFLMVLSSDHISPATGKTITSQISKDGGAFASMTNSANEVGSGVYKITITQAEMNADVLVLKFTSTSCDQRTITVLTST